MLSQCLHAGSDKETWLTHEPGKGLTYDCAVHMRTCQSPSITLLGQRRCATGQTNIWKSGVIWHCQAWSVQKDQNDWYSDQLGMKWTYHDGACRHHEKTVGKRYGHGLQVCIHNNLVLTLGHPRSQHSSRSRAQGLKLRLAWLAHSPSRPTSHPANTNCFYDLGSHKESPLSRTATPALPTINSPEKLSQPPTRLRSCHLSSISAAD